MELNNRKEITYKQCSYCGKFIRMICQIGTGFCSQQCMDNAAIPGMAHRGLNIQNGNG